MEAVMQLAQAASQQQYDEHQQHGQVENPDVHHDSLPVNNSEESGAAGVEKRGEKRRQSHSSVGARGGKNARQDEQDVASAAAAAAAAAANLPFPDSWSEGTIPAEFQKAYQQHLASGGFTSASPTQEDPSSSTASPSKPARQLSTSKRAAQNRAAQRAFRERREKYVKVLESKSSRLEVAIRVATECKRRYMEALQTIDGLRGDNHTLRVALAALSGSSIEGNAPPSKAEELIATLPEIPLVTTDEEEAVLAGVQQGHAGAGMGAGGEGGNGGQSLDSLSAVAAAAAAAVGQESAGASQTDEAAQSQPQNAESQPEASRFGAALAKDSDAQVTAASDAKANNANAGTSGVSLPPVPTTTSTTSSSTTEAQ